MDVRQNFFPKPSGGRPPCSAPSPCSHRPSFFVASVCIVGESEGSCASSLQRDAEAQFQRRAMDHHEALCRKVFF